MCLINHRYRYVFVHVPKTGGSSIAHYLAPLTSYRDQEIGVTGFGEAIASAFYARFKLSKHATYAEISAVMGAEEIAGYTTFAALRDPADRTRSAFRFLKGWTVWAQLPQFEPYASEFLATDDINQFIASRFFRSPGPDRIFMPQYTWIGTESEVHVDRLLSAAALEADIRAFIASVGVDLSVLPDTMPRFNESNHSDVNDVLDERSTVVVNERYARDFALFRSLSATTPAAYHAPLMTRQRP